MAQKWKYNDREFEALHGFNMSEMDFRQYDPALGRFTGIDVMAGYMPSINPYQFGFNNPVYFSDPFGQWPLPIGLGAALAGLADAITSGAILLQEVQVNGTYTKPQGEAPFGGGSIPYASLMYSPFGGGGSGGPGGGGSTSGGPSNGSGPSGGSSNSNGSNVNGGINGSRPGIPPGGSVGGVSGRPDGRRPIAPIVNVDPVDILYQNIIVQVDVITPRPLSVRTPSKVPAPTPRVGDVKIPKNSSVTMHRPINYENSSGKLKDNGVNQKTLNALIKTLVDYPQLKVLIQGNVSVLTDESVNRSTPVRIDGQNGTLGGLQLRRADAIRKFLISRGININRISIGNGAIYTDGTTPNATFVISNPK